jgi:hypothetical protein
MYYKKSYKSVALKYFRSESQKAEGIRPHASDRDHAFPLNYRPNVLTELFRETT